MKWTPIVHGENDYEGRPWWTGTNIELGPDEIVILEYQNGTIRVFSRLNLLGGICDHCTDDVGIPIAWATARIKYNGEDIGIEKTVL